MKPPAQQYTFPIDRERELLLTLKEQVINVFETPANNLWTFDWEGRLVGMYVNGVNYRRTLENRFFKKSRWSAAGETFRTVEAIRAADGWELIARCKSLLQEKHMHLPENFQSAVERIVGWTPERLQAEEERFCKIYRPISILPPDQYLALVLQITEGCNYNRCAFCNFYRDRPFRIKPLAEVAHHVETVKTFLGAGIRLRRSIFLADANALVIPQRKLLPMLRHIRQNLPAHLPIYSFIDVFTGIKKSAQNFSQLKERGVKRVYLGVESGHPDLLALLNKPQSWEALLDLTQKLKAGGLAIGVIFLAGAGGEPFRERHRQASTKLVSEMPLTKGDIIYVSEFYETNPEYRQVLGERQIQPPNRLEIRRTAKELKRAFREVTDPDVKVAVYDIQQFFY